MFSACLPVSQSLRSDARCCNGHVSRLSPCVSRVSCCLPVSPSLCGQMPDAVTLAPGSCLPLVLVSATLAPGPPCVSQLLQSEARCCDAGSGVVSRLSPCASLVLSRLPPVSFPACLPVSAVRYLRCCNAGSRVVSPACLPVSCSLCDAVTMAPGSCLPLVSVSFCGQRPDAKTPAPGRSHACLPVSPSLAVAGSGVVSTLISRCLPISSPCVSESLRLDARCCDAGSGVVSPACPRQMLRRVSRLSFVSQSLRSDLPSFEADLACLWQQRN